MILIELFVPRGVLGEAERERLGARLIDALMSSGDPADPAASAAPGAPRDPGAPPDPDHPRDPGTDAGQAAPGGHAAPVMDAARALTQVLVHEPAGWVVGGAQPVDPADPPRYLVRVSAPAAWRKEMSGHAIERLTGVLARSEADAGRDPGRLLREPHAWVHVVGVSEGALGLCGQAMGSLGLIEHMTRPHREDIAGMPVGALPPGHVIDPVCGMTVNLAETDLTLDVDGITYGFCNGACRRIYADDHGVPLTA